MLPEDKIKVYRIECPISGDGCVYMGQTGAGRLMTNRGIGGPYSRMNPDIDKDVRDLHQDGWWRGVFFFTEEGWKKAGYAVTRSLNRQRLKYKVIKGVVKYMDVLYKDAYQVVTQRRYVKNE